MANLSEIKKDSNWGDTASTINSNFQNINVDLEKVKSSTTKFKGYFTTETALKNAYPSPKVGDTAWVGATYPGTLYDVQTDGTWHNTGTVPDTGSVDLTDYATKEELEELENKTAGVNYVTCGTSANTAAKTVSITGLTSLTTGIRLLVKMTNNNTASNATLNINSLGAKPLYYDNERASSDNSWEAGEVIDVYYDGTNFYAGNVQGGSSDGGNRILEWKSDAATTRKQVPLKDRKELLQISYKDGEGNAVNEQYIGTSVDDTEWSKDNNWIKIPNQEQLNEIETQNNEIAIEIYGRIVLEASETVTGILNTEGEVESASGFSVLTYNVRNYENVYLTMYNPENPIYIGAAMYDSGNNFIDKIDIDETNYISNYRFVRPENCEYIKIVKWKQEAKVEYVDKGSSNIEKLLTELGEEGNTLGNQEPIFTEKGALKIDGAIDTGAVGEVQKFKLSEGADYYASYRTPSDSKYAAYAYYDVNETFIKSYRDAANGYYKDKLIEKVQNAKYIKIYAYTSSGDEINLSTNSENTESTGLYKRIEDLEKKGDSKEVNIFFIGNSVSQDCVTYLPYVLQEIAPNLIFKICIWYVASLNLKEQLGYMQAGNKGEFSVWKSGDTKWSTSSLTIDEILENNTFDVISLQEYFNRRDAYSDEDYSDYNNLIDYIAEKHKNSFIPLSLMHAPKRNIADEVMQKIVTSAKMMIKHTYSEGILPCGWAIYNAMKNDKINSLGDVGNLSNDGVHAQEGLPCVMQSFVIALWIFKRFALPYSVVNSQITITQEQYSSMAIPGANGGLIVSDYSLYKEAEREAEIAFKEGLSVESSAFS